MLIFERTKRAKTYRRSTILGVNNFKPLQWTIVQEKDENLEERSCSQAPALFRREKWCRTWTWSGKWSESLNELRHIFYWLQQLDGMIGQTQGPCALLFVDYASSHGTSTNLSSLQLTQLEYLSLNTAHLLRPLDLRTIAHLNKRYKSMIAKSTVSWLASGPIENPHRWDIR